MPRKSRQWGNLTPVARERAARQAAKDFGLSRRQARERYNRGTYQPFARDPIKRIPKSAPRMPIQLGRDLKDAAIKNMDKQLGEKFEYNRFTMIDAIEYHASIEALQRMAGASKDELLTWASAQPDKRNKSKPEKGTPSWLRSLGFMRKGKWSNVFWYH